MNLLDSRGYCIVSKCSFEIDCDYKPTLPSKHYPSAAPYAALTEFLRELIHERILTRFIVKALLYPEFLRDIDTTEVKLRKRHKTFVRMVRRGSSTSSSGESETSSERLDCQNTTESASDGGSEIYSGVKYKTGRKRTDSWEGTVYESFIDHGEGAGEVCYQRLRDSVNSFCFVTECEAPISRESYMIGSTPTRYVERKQKDSNDSVIHLTTAKMTLLDIKQKSEQSQTSSFEHKLSGHGWKNMACEDLLNMDDSMKIKDSCKSNPLQERHHSMPVQFVGNRFNVSSLTEIFIPSCKSQNENANNKLATPYNSFEENEQQHQRSNSSSMPDRDQKTPEKPSNQVSYNVSFEILNKEPREPDFNDARYSSSSRKISIEFESHSSNDKDKSLNQMLPTRLTDHEQNKKFDSKFAPPTTIYSSDSDSGMAGSYTLSPSDHTFGFNSHKFNPAPSSIDYFAPNTISDNMESLNHGMSRFLPQSESLSGENRSKVVINFENVSKSGATGERVFISGMYAHWWKKENLPLEMLESIAKPSEGESDKRNRGSGKKSLKIHFNDVAHSCLPFSFCNFLHSDND